MYLQNNICNIYIVLQGTYWWYLIITSTFIHWYIYIWYGLVKLSWFIHENIFKSSFGTTIYLYIKLQKIIKFNNLNATSHLKKKTSKCLSIINICRSGSDTRRLIIFWLIFLSGKNKLFWHSFVLNQSDNQIVQQSGETLSPVSSFLEIEIDEVEDDNRHRQGMF